MKVLEVKSDRIRVEDPNGVQTVVGRYNDDNGIYFFNERNEKQYALTFIEDVPTKKPVSKTKTFITCDGLYRGREDDIDGVWMNLWYNPVTKAYRHCGTWFERSAVKSLEDIKELKAEKVKKMLKELRKDIDLKPPYVYINTIFNYSYGKENDSQNGDGDYDITIKALESMMDSDPNEIYLDFRVYAREGNPHDWSEWERTGDDGYIKIMEILKKPWL